MEDFFSSMFPSYYFCFVLEITEIFCYPPPPRWQTQEIQQAQLGTSDLDSSKVFGSSVDERVGLTILRCAMLAVKSTTFKAFTSFDTHAHIGNSTDYRFFYQSESVPAGFYPHSSTAEAINPLILMCTSKDLFGPIQKGETESP